MSQHLPKRRAEAPRRSIPRLTLPARPARRRRNWRKTLVGLLSLVLILGGATYTAYARYDGNITRVDVTDGLGKRPEQVVAGPMNVLVLGSDTRKGQTGNIGGVTEGLSDTTIMLHLSEDRSRAYGVSIPRDTMVRRPACRTASGEISRGELAQFNDAYKVGGAACTLKTVESITKVRFDHVMVIDFNGFRNMVDALGGVEICVPEPVDDPVGNIRLDEGTYEVDGETALDYVRVRHGLSPNGDIGRVKRQQAFVAAMISKLVGVGTLTNPLKLTRFLDAATKSLTTDEDFDTTEIAGVANSLRGIGLDNVEFITAPWQPYPADENRVELKPEADRLWRQMRLDKPLGAAFTEEVVRASDRVDGKPRRGGQGGGAQAGGGASASPSQEETTSAEERSAMAAANGLCG